MLDKLIAYLKNLPEEEQKKLADAIARSEQTEDIKPLKPQTEQTEESTESETTEQTEEQDEKAQDETTDGGTEEQTDTEQVEEEPTHNEQAGSTNDATEEQTEQLATDNPPDFQELLETKIELALIKAGIREDRVEAAKRLFKTEIHSIEDLEKIKDLIKEFPEWQKQKEQGKSFGVPIKDNGTSLTEEEKKLKAMGIDPKN